MTHFKYALCYCLERKNSYDSLCPTFAIQIAHFKVEKYWKLFPFFNINKSIRNWYLQEVFFCEELLVVNASIVIRMK